MALERVPADIRAQGGVARMSDPSMIKEIMKAVTIPVMAKSRIGHFVECQVRLLRLPDGQRIANRTLFQILEAIGVDFIDESEVLTPADDTHHTEKHLYAVPFVCGCKNLGEALRRISEGAAMSTWPSLSTSDFVSKANISLYQSGLKARLVLAMLWKLSSICVLSLLKSCAHQS
jgi:pyridoxal 5'-phosphate synthase pdxS subunit